MPKGRGVPRAIQLDACHLVEPAEARGFPTLRGTAGKAWGRGRRAVTAFILRPAPSSARGLPQGRRVTRCSQASARG